MTNVLFLCTGNSCRSQMAEGWARAQLSPAVNAYSAGTKPGSLNELAVRVMLEVGVDISNHHSKHLSELQDISFDVIVTVCDSAAASCPTPPPGSRVIHAPFDDPPQLAIGALSVEEKLHHYRRVRDEIKELINSLPQLLEQGE